jgi:hypothetical protein
MRSPRRLLRGGGRAADRAIRRETTNRARQQPTMRQSDAGSHLMKLEHSPAIASRTG